MYNLSNLTPPHMLSKKPPTQYPIKIKSKGPNFPVVAVKTINLHEPVNAFIYSRIERQKNILKTSPDSLTPISLYYKEILNHIYKHQQN